jgi:hypothetical protein
MMKPSVRDIGAASLVAFAALAVAIVLWAGYVIWEKVVAEVKRGDELTQSLAKSEAGVLRLQQQVESLGAIPALAPAPITVSGKDGLSIVGPAGLQGIPGLSGGIGLTGLTGLTGANGIAGKPGATGSAGVSGVDGVAGAAGEPGAAGKDGTDGKNGRDGTNGTTPDTVYCRPADVSGVQTCTVSSPTPTPTTQGTP